MAAIQTVYGNAFWVNEPFCLPDSVVYIPAPFVC